jgi:aspartyl-tRNA synthetase
MSELATSLRTHTCGELRAGDAGRQVTLSGWVHRVRDHGGVFFLDLRDRFGITQVVTRPGETSEALLNVVRDARPEHVLRIVGEVALRPEGMVNRERSTGEIEVLAGHAQVLAVAQTPPFQVEGETTAGEDLRLEYRYLDLRRPDLQAVLALRHRASQAARRYLDSLGFLEIETPMLVKPTPEGARDFLVPSRERPGRFYALPQSPQLYKQILMVAGLDRYFQLARCLRDEDLRADRQPEHTQIDLEMSFAGDEDVYAVIEGLLASVFREVLGLEIETPFERIDYDNCMDRYGSDKPDLRYPGELVDVTDLLEGSGFRLFGEAKANGQRVKALAVPGGAALSRKESDALETEVKLGGAKGLARAKVGGCGLETGIAKHLEEDRAAELIRVTGAAQGDLLGLVVAERMVACRALGRLRALLAARHAEQQRSVGQPLGTRFAWVWHFPLFGARPSHVHHAAREGHAALGERSAGGARATLRPGPERRGTGERQRPYTQARHPGARDEGDRTRGRRGRAEIRLPAEGVPVRGPASRGDRVGSRPAGDAHGGPRLDPRHDCLPEDDQRTVARRWGPCGGQRSGPEGASSQG